MNTPPSPAQRSFDAFFDDVSHPQPDQLTACAAWTRISIPARPAPRSHHGVDRPTDADRDVPFASSQRVRSPAARRNAVPRKSPPENSARAHSESRYIERILHIASRNSQFNPTAIAMCTYNLTPHSRHAWEIANAPANGSIYSTRNCPRFAIFPTRTETARTPRPTGVAMNILESKLAATDLVCVAPLSWYSVPTNAKLYLDHRSGWMRVSETRSKHQWPRKSFGRYRRSVTQTAP
jgi:hypothetical protein